MKNIMHEISRLEVKKLNVQLEKNDIERDIEKIWVEIILKRGY